MDIACGAGDWLVGLLPSPGEGSVTPELTLVDPPEAADVTLSSEDATEPTWSLLLLVAVRSDSGLDGPVTACAAAVATAAAPSSE